MNKNLKAYQSQVKQQQQSSTKSIFKNKIIPKISLAQLQKNYIEINKKRKFNCPFNTSQVNQSTYQSTYKIANNSNYSKNVDQTNDQFSIIQPYYCSRFQCSNDKKSCKCPFHGPRIKIIPNIIKKSNNLSNHRRIRTDGIQFLNKNKENQQSIKEKIDKNIQKVKTVQNQKNLEMKSLQLSTRLQYLKQLKQYENRRKNTEKKKVVKFKPSLDCKNEQFQEFLRNNKQKILEDMKTQSWYKYKQNTVGILKKQTCINSVNQKNNDLIEQNINLRKASLKKKSNWLRRYNSQNDENYQNFQYNNSNEKKKRGFVISQKIKEQILKQQVQQFLELDDKKFQEISQQIQKEIRKAIAEKTIYKKDIVFQIQNKVQNIKGLSLKIKDKLRLKQKIMNDLSDQINKQQQIDVLKQTIKSLKSSRGIRKKMTHKLSIAQHLGKNSVNFKLLRQSFNKKSKENMNSQQSQESNSQSNTEVQMNQNSGRKRKSIFYNESQKKTKQRSSLQLSTKQIGNQCLKYIKNNRNSQTINNKQLSRRNGINKIKQSMQQFLKNRYGEDLVNIGSSSSQNSQPPQQNQFLQRELDRYKNMKISKNQQSEKNENIFNKYYTTLFNKEKNNQQQSYDNRKGKRNSQKIKTIFFIQKHKKVLLYYRQLIKRVQQGLQSANLKKIIINAQNDSVFTKRRKIRMIRQKLEDRSIFLDSQRQFCSQEDLQKYLDLYDQYCMNIIKTLKRQTLNSKNYQVALADQHIQHKLDLEFMNQLTLKFYLLKKLQSNSEQSDQQKLWFRMDRFPSRINNQRTKTQILNQKISKLQNSKFNDNQIVQACKSHKQQNFCQIGLGDSTLPEKIIQKFTNRYDLLTENNYKKQRRANKTQGSQNAINSFNSYDQNKKNYLNFSLRSNLNKSQTASGFLNINSKFHSKRLLDSIKQRCIVDKRTSGYSSFEDFFSQIYSQSKLIREKDQIKKIFKFVLTKHPNITHHFNQFKQTCSQIHQL